MGIAEDRELDRQLNAARDTSGCTFRCDSLRGPCRSSRPFYPYSNRSIQVKRRRQVKLSR